MPSNKFYAISWQYSALASSKLCQHKHNVMDSDMNIYLTCTQSIVIVNSCKLYWLILLDVKSYLYVHDLYLFTFLFLLICVVNRST